MRLSSSNVMANKHLPFVLKCLRYTLYANSKRSSCCSPSVWLIVEAAAKLFLLDGELVGKLDVELVGGFVGGLFVFGVAKIIFFVGVFGELLLVELLDLESVGLLVLELVELLLVELLD